MNRKNNIKNILSNTKVIVLAIVLSLGLSYASATWVAPSQAPTGANAEAPINVGNTNQAKGSPVALQTSLLDINGTFSALNILSFNDITGDNLSQVKNPSLTYDNGLIGVCANTVGKLVACERTSGGGSGGSSGYIECGTSIAGVCKDNNGAVVTAGNYSSIAGYTSGNKPFAPGGPLIYPASVEAHVLTSVIPTNVTQVTIEVWGGGGAGGNTVFSSCYSGYTGGAGGGGGGGGGGYTSGTYNLAGMTEFEIKIPAHSNPGAPCTDDSESGGLSRVKFIGGSYSSTQWPTATGGYSGTGSIASGITTGGTGGSSSTPGNLNIAGANGGIGTIPAGLNGGAGGASGNPAGGFGNGGSGSCSANGCSPSNGSGGRVKISW